MAKVCTAMPLYALILEIALLWLGIIINNNNNNNNNINNNHNNNNNNNTLIFVKRKIRQNALNRA